MSIQNKLTKEVRCIPICMFCVFIAATAGTRFVCYACFKYCSCKSSCSTFPLTSAEHNVISLIPTTLTAAKPDCIDLVSLFGRSVLAVLSMATRSVQKNMKNIELISVIICPMVLLQPAVQCVFILLKLLIFFFC